MIPRVGMILYGYCNGYFSCDSYEPRRIEALGADWVVVRERDGRPSFASFGKGKNMDELLVEWSRMGND
jgi:hypothetical protein